jgi:hypothetical protein
MLAFVTVVVGFFYVFTVFDCELKKKKIKSMKSSKQPTNYIRKILKYTVLRFESLFFLQINFFFWIRRSFSNDCARRTITYNKIIAEIEMKV